MVAVPGPFVGASRDWAAPRDFDASRRSSAASSCATQQISAYQAGCKASTPPMRPTGGIRRVWEESSMDLDSRLAPTLDCSARLLA